MLTRDQLHALSLLHMRGELHGQGRGIGLPGPRQATLNALVAAGVAKRADDTGRRFLPVLNAYADGAGTWHVEIPDEIPNEMHAGIGRAVIAGEVWQRERQAYIMDWRPRVRYAGRHRIIRDRKSAGVVCTYREA